MDCKVSIILPVYNGMKYLDVAVSSVLNQTFTDFEFLILDDCSTDGSWEYLRNIKDDRVTVLRNDTNRGLFYNLNFLVRKSGSELIKLWSQDDYMTPDAIEKIVAFYNKHPQLGFCYTSFKLINEEGAVIKEAKEDITPEVVDQATHAKIAFTWGSIAGNIANVAISRKAFDKVGLFNESMKICGDFEMWVRISEFFDIGLLKDPVIYIRNHSGQLSKNEDYYINHVSEDLLVYKKLFSFIPERLRKEGIHDMRRSKLLFYYTLMLHAFRKRKFREGCKYWKEIGTFDSPLLLTFYFIGIKLLRLK